jgi:glycopeptide antibiotics resistance protein
MNTLLILINLVFFLPVGLLIYLRYKEYIKKETRKENIEESEGN